MSVLPDTRNPGAWIVSRIAGVGDDLQAIINQQIEAEANTCPRCRGFLDATGWLPADCPDCGTVRDGAWRCRQERQARQTLRARKERR